MITISNMFVGIVILLHIYFLVLEMFLWDKPFGLQTFDIEPDFASASKSLAANQGLSNGFLAAGLVWGLANFSATGISIKVFFLSCVVVAGVFGALTVKKQTLLFQALPAAVAHGITTPLRMAHFLAQAMQETGGFTVLRENMNYSAPRLVEIFGVGKHSAKVTQAEAATLAHHPEAAELI